MRQRQILIDKNIDMRDRYRDIRDINRQIYRDRDETDREREKCHLQTAR